MARVWRDGQKKEVHIYRFIMTVSKQKNSFHPHPTHPAGRGWGLFVSVEEGGSWVWATKQVGADHIGGRIFVKFKLI